MTQPNTAELLALLVIGRNQFKQKLDKGHNGKPLWQGHKIACESLLTRFEAAISQMVEVVPSGEPLTESEYIAIRYRGYTNEPLPANATYEMQICWMVGKNAQEGTNFDIV